MPFPSTALTTLRPDLAQSVEQFDLAADRQGFIGLQVAPVIDAMKAAGTYGVIPLEQLLQNQDTVRAPGSGYKRGRFSFKTAGYATVEHGWEEPVDESEAELYSSYFKAEQFAAARSLDFTLRGHEQRVATYALNSANTGGNTGCSAVWSNHSGATPIEDIEGAIQNHWKTTGLWPNAIAMHRLAFRHLRQCQEVIDRIKYSGFTDPKAGKITTAIMAEVFDIEEIIVAGSAQNSANEGAAASITPIWDSTKVLVFRRAMSEDAREPSFMRTFHYAEDGSSIGGTMEAYPEPQTRSNVIRCRNQTAEQAIYTNASYLLTGAMSTNGGPT